MWKFCVMHELSIARNVFDIIQESTNAYPDREIEKVVIEVGSIAGIEIEPFKTALNELNNYAIQKVEQFCINEITSKASCRMCNTHFKPDGFFIICPECYSQQCTLLTGKELKIKNITLKN